MKLILNGHRYRFEMENICQLFFPFEPVNVEKEEENARLTAVTTVEDAGDAVRLEAVLEAGGERWRGEETLEKGGPHFDKECERRLAVLLYRQLAALTGREHAWGAVTGVRPVKLIRRMAARLGGADAAAGWLREALLVGEDKAALCRRTLDVENGVLALSRPESASLYISVPFCPTRCDYCSFVSHTVERAGRLLPDYVDCLCRELEVTGALAARQGLRLETVYIGGGTPTTLSAAQLARVMETAARSFDLSAVREYCVEAGRPDTVADAEGGRDKLRAIKDGGATRISINPQTMRDEVLAAVGRRHTAAQFREAFALARRCGFGNINADLIAGLPGDDGAGFRRSMDELIAMGPESITVHALAMKRASNLTVRGRTGGDGHEAIAMVDYGARALDAAGYRPYYLYRQSRAAGNMENTGWAKPGYEGLYNVFIMDETHTILGCGAGAVTKLKRPGGDLDSEKIERVFNFKFPYEYIGRFDEMLERKKRAEDWIGRHW